MFPKYPTQVSHLHWSNRLIDERQPWRLKITSQWRHNERDGVSNQQRLDCLLSHLFRRRSKKTSKLRVTGLGEGNSPVTGRASNAENVSIWLRHHEIHAKKLERAVIISFKSKHKPCTYIVDILITIALYLRNIRMLFCFLISWNLEPVRFVV